MLPLARVVVLPVVLAAMLPAQEAKPAPLTDRYQATSQMLAMRDGVKLHTIVVVDQRAKEPLPFVMLRTPYGVANWQRHFGSYMKDLAEDGYVFVFQDIRGRHESEGTFVMQRPLRATDPRLVIDECTDAYDTIDWLVKNVPHNNGRVGMLGISYDGWTTIMAAAEPHPALRAISPQASPADMWLGDDFHHNGAFRLSYGFEYAVMMETAKTQAPFKFDGDDTFEWYLNLGSLAHVNERFLHEKIPTWNDYTAHPDYDAFWQAQTVIQQLKSCTVPTLNVAGWWDQEDFYGPIAIYEALEKHDTQHHNHLVVGPWNHGGWSRGDGDRLGAIQFGSKTAAWFREHVQAVWFRHWLKDQGKLDLPEALTFEAAATNGATGTRGRRTPRPSRSSTCTPVASCRSMRPPRRRASVRRVRRGSGQARALPQSADQTDLRTRLEVERVARRRPAVLEGPADVLRWQTDVLEQDVTIAGAIEARLFASTTGTDADWIVKLIDVLPESEAVELAGRELMVANEVFRGRYRNGFTKPEPLPAGEVVPFAWSLHTQNYTWKKGHRIMVQVQSTWFPLIDRNPQTFVPNIFLAADGDFRAQTHRVFRSAKAASCVVLPVVAQRR
jgi:putative CocE/NonD family hydrolase